MYFFSSLRAVEEDDEEVPKFKLMKILMTFTLSLIIILFAHITATIRATLSINICTIERLKFHERGLLMVPISTYVPGWSAKQLAYKRETKFLEKWRFIFLHNLL